MCAYAYNVHVQYMNAPYNVLASAASRAFEPMTTASERRMTGMQSYALCECVNRNEDGAVHRGVEVEGRTMDAP